MGENSYLLLIYLNKPRTIKIGKLGSFYFKKGNYIYVGSAKRNLPQRVERHLRKKKKKFWHIDYLLQYARIKEVWVSSLGEEGLAKILLGGMEIPLIGFGASDKKDKSHLFYGKITKNFLISRGLKTQSTKVLTSL